MPEPLCSGLALGDFGLKVLQGLDAVLVIGFRHPVKLECLASFAQGQAVTFEAPDKDIVVAEPAGDRRQRASDLQAHVLAGDASDDVVVGDAESSPGRGKRGHHDGAAKVPSRRLDDMGHRDLMGSTARHKIAVDRPACATSQKKRNGQ